MSSSRGWPKAWTSSADGLTHTITLKPGIRVLGRRAADLRRRPLLVSRRVRPRAWPARSARPSRVHGKPLEVTAPDARTVVVRFPEPFAPGLRLLDSLPIVPRHKLEAALERPGSSRTPGCRRSPSPTSSASGRFSSSSTSPDSGSSSRATRTTSGATRPASSCRISIASRSSSCPTRTPRRCGSKPPRAI